MNSFDDIKNLWQNQPAAQAPDFEAIKKAANKSRRHMMARSLLALILLGGTLVFIVYIVLMADFKYQSTKLGAGLVIIAILFAMVFNAQMLQLIMKEADFTSSNQAYLQQLITYRDKQRSFLTKGMVVYFILLSAGLMLYLYEFYARNPVFGLKAYALTILWIAFVWFYFKPRAIEKREKKINALIEQIQSICEQLKK